jgi:hypothetical protein
MTRLRVPIDKLRQTRTKIMVNLGNPKPDALQSSMRKSKGKTVATRRAIGEKPPRAECLPDQQSDGVLLARMEFIINQRIGIHPMAFARSQQRRGVSSFSARPKSQSTWSLLSCAANIGFPTNTWFRFCSAFLLSRLMSSYESGVLIRHASESAEAQTQQKTIAAN